MWSKDFVLGSSCIYPKYATQPMVRKNYCPTA